MTRGRSLVVAAVLSALVLTAAPGHGSTGEGDPYRVEPPTGTFTGIDGILYNSAPQVVDGLGGELFYGPDFDVACGVGAGYISSMRAMTKLAKVIEKSGRQAIWTGAPSKTSVLSDSLDVSQLPHGRCDRRGLREQRKLIDSYDDPNFLSLIGKLSDDPRQVYWRTDPHWTSVGGAVSAKSVAGHLDRRLGKRQRYTLGTETRMGLFSIWRGEDTPETLQTALPATAVRSRTARKSVEDYTGYPAIVLDHSWTSSPVRRTWPGHTLLLGDSMMLLALANMRPVFRHGRYMWVEHMRIEDVVAAIVKADTVVLEVLQTFLPLGQVLISSDFRKAVAKALDRDQRD
jgi:alginate O-acetyltransferase complex protein AlgJ